MRMTKLAFLNFKSSAKSFMSLILSLAFTIMIFLNFQNVTYSNALIKLGEHNKDYADIIIQVLCFIMGVFSFFYIWYATNVFLTKRKKEIGIYIFMGLSNEKIGKMYMIESALIGISALVLGLFFGGLTTGLFQMILSRVSDIAVDVSFKVTLKPIVITGIVYVIIYAIFVWKGYFNIVRSSVLGMISAARQNEYVRQNPILLFFKAVLGCIVLGSGFYLSMRKNQMDWAATIVGAVVLVTIGVYLIFGGLLPFLFQRLAKNKNFLYQKQRNLWINQVIFRMKKNYRTYAMVSVLALSAVTALAAGFAVKNRYDNMMYFDRIYTFQFITNLENLNQEAEAIISKNSDISFQNKASAVVLEAKEGDSGWEYNKGYIMLSYSEIKELAEAAGLECEFEEPAENEVVELGNLPLMSFIGYGEGELLILNGKAYERTEVARQPYLGYLQKMGGVTSYVVNDAEYERLLALGAERMYIFNYRITDTEDFIPTRDALNVIMEKNTVENYVGRVAVDPTGNDIDWIKVLYCLCIFIFAVFIMASGCIMLMKIYNDSSEEKDRYTVMKKLGAGELALRKSIACELGAAYGLSFLVMAISSYFSVNALAKTMLVNLLAVNVASVLIIFVIFVVFYLFSLAAYWRSVGI